MTAKVVVHIPPGGRLGIKLVDDADGRGVTVSAVDSDYAAVHAIRRGDRVVSINEVDVTEMNATGKHKKTFVYAHYFSR